MNFEFKSTFNLLNIIRTLLSVRFAWRVLTLNIVVVSIILVLYLQNIILPAVIGSREDAQQWILILELGYASVLVSSAMAVARIFFHLTWTRLEQVAETIRIISIRIYFVMQFSLPLRHSYTLSALPVIPHHELYDSGLAPTHFELI